MSESNPTWRPTGPARRAYVAREDNGITRSMYVCTFVTDPDPVYPDTPGGWLKRRLEFFALKPGLAVKQIAAKGVPMSLSGQVIN